MSFIFLHPLFSSLSFPFISAFPRCHLSALPPPDLRSPHRSSFFYLFYLIPPSLVWSWKLGLGDRSPKDFQLQRSWGNNSHSQVLMERQAKKKRDRINCREKKRQRWGGGADSNFVFFSPSSAPRDDGGSLMCGVSALSLSVSHSFLSLCPLVVSRPPSPFVCVVIYFIHSFRLSICIRRRRRKAGGVGGDRGIRNFLLCFS